MQTLSSVAELTERRQDVVILTRDWAHIISRPETGNFVDVTLLPSEAVVAVPEHSNHHIASYIIDYSPLDDILEQESAGEPTNDLFYAAKQVIELSKDLPATIPCTVGGNGSCMPFCTHCHGTQYNYRYPELELINDETGQKVAVTLNAAELIANGRLPITKFDRDYSADFRAVLKSLAAEAGVDPTRVIGVHGDRTFDLLDDNRVETVHYNHVKDEPDFLTGVLQKLQSGTAFKYSYSPEGRDQDTLDDNGVKTTTRFYIKELPKVREALLKLIEGAEKCGMLLGYTVAFYETESYAPLLSLYNKDLSYAGSLAQGYEIGHVILNAWTAFQKKYSYEN